MLKSLPTIGSLQFPTMLVPLVRTRSLAVILGPEWTGVMAVVGGCRGSSNEDTTSSMSMSGGVSPSVT